MPEKDADANLPQVTFCIKLPRPLLDSVKNVGPVELSTVRPTIQWLP
jgi:hypothetical protein